MTEQKRVKGVEKDRTNNSTRECYKIAKQAKTKKNSSKERKKKSTQQTKPKYNTTG